MYCGTKREKIVSFPGVFLFDNYSTMKGHFWSDIITVHLYERDQSESLSSLKLLPRSGTLSWLLVWDSIFCYVPSTWWVINFKKKKSLKHKQKISIDHMSLLLNDALFRGKRERKAFDRSLSFGIMTPLVNCIIKIS